MALTQLDYEIIKGEAWERLVIVKDYRSHRIRAVKSATSMLRDANGVLHPITTDISFEGGISLTLTAAQTVDLPTGDYTFDVVADPWGETRTVAQGTVTVTDINRITPLGGNSTMYISYDPYTDFRKPVTWTTSAGDVIEITDARLQARDIGDAVVLDLGFFETPPDEAAIALLDPEKRGYLSPLEGASFEIHISDQAVIATGTYSFDILAQDSTGDWARVAKGTLAVSDPVTDSTS